MWTNVYLANSKIPCNFLHADFKQMIAALSMKLLIPRNRGRGHGTTLMVNSFKNSAFCFIGQRLDTKLERRILWSLMPFVMALNPQLRKRSQCSKMRGFGNVHINVARKSWGDHHFLLLLFFWFSIQWNSRNITVPVVDPTMCQLIGIAFSESLGRPRVKEFADGLFNVFNSSDFFLDRNALKHRNKL